MSRMSDLTVRAALDTAGVTRGVQSIIQEMERAQRAARENLGNFTPPDISAAAARAGSSAGSEFSSAFAASVEADSQKIATAVGATAAAVEEAAAAANDASRPQVVYWDEWAASVREAKGEADAMAREQTDLQGAVGRTNRQVQMSHKEMERLEEQSKAAWLAARDLKTGTTAAAVAVTQAGDAATRSVGGWGRLNNALVTVARQTAGVHPVMGQLVDVVGTFALGTAVMVGVLAGLAALAAAWNHVRREAREAAREQEEAIERATRVQERQQVEELGPGGQSVIDLEEVEQQVVRIDEMLTNLRQNGFKGRAFGPDGGQLQILKETIGDYKTLGEAIDKLEDKRSDAIGQMAALRQDISSKEVADAERRQRELEQQTEKELRAIEEISRARQDMSDTLRTAQITSAFGIIDTSKLTGDFGDAVAEAETLRAQFRSLTVQIDALRKAGQGVPSGALQLLNRLQAALAEADAEVRSRTQSLKESFDSLTELDLAPEVTRPIIELGVVVDTFSLESLERSFELQTARIQEQFVRGIIDERGMEEQGKQAADAFNAGLLETIERLRSSGKLTEALELAGKLKLTDLDVETSFVETMEGVREVVSAFGDLADALDKLSPELANALRGIETLTAGAARIQAGQAAGGVMGALGVASGIMSVMAGMIQIGQSLTGDSEREQRRNALMEQNNQALDRLRETMQNPTTFGDANQAQDIIDRLQSWAARPLSERGPMTISPGEIDLIRRLGDQYGIQPVNAAGGINMNTLRALEEALKLAARNVIEFGSTLAGQRTLQDAFNEIFDVTDPGKLLQSQFDILAKQAPELFGGLLNIDLTSSIGREVLETRIRDLITQAMAGELDAEALAGFQSVDEFLQHLLGLDQGLDAFAEGINRATEALVNVPQGFRILNLEMIRFNSMIAQRAEDLIPSGGGAGAGPTVDPNKGRPPYNPGTGEVPRDRPTLSIGTVNVQVTQNDGEDSEAFARRVGEVVTQLNRENGLIYAGDPNAYGPA